MYQQQQKSKKRTTSVLKVNIDSECSIEGSKK